MTWHPAAGMNIILGGGNVGKTTLLDAIALLLHPTNSYALADADYWNRSVEDEFCIEAVIFLPEEIGISKQTAFPWPWEWDSDSKDAVLPMAEGEGGARDPVYKIRVRGTADLELLHEVVQPDGSTVPFSTAFRRNIGIVRLSGDDRSDRDLRLIQGGVLDRLLADKTLRAKLGRKVALDSAEDELTGEAQGRLVTLNTTFAERALPNMLGLGFVGGSGLSINALVGLTAGKNGVRLPLTCWGAGTRRLAALAIADTLQGKAPITLVDELERGLEPYRQRRLVYSLQRKNTQILVTTHSAAVISAAAGAALWYLDAKGTIGSLPSEKVDGHQARDPEAFLARLAIVAEGATEVGFIQILLEQLVGALWEDEGIRVTDGGGNDAVLKLLEALSAGGLCFAGFADHEAANPNPGRWKKVKDKLGPLLLRWEKGCLEENILPLFKPETHMKLIGDPDGDLTGVRLRTLADRLEIKDNTFEAVFAAAGDDLIIVIIEAATGYVPDSLKTNKSISSVYKAHAKQWFKSLDGGRELGQKLFDLNVWSDARCKLLPFVNAIREVLSMSSLLEE